MNKERQGWPGGEWHGGLCVWCVVQGGQNGTPRVRKSSDQPLACPSALGPDLLSSSSSLSGSPVFLAASSIQHCAKAMADTLRSQPPHRPPV